WSAAGVEYIQFQHDGQPYRFEPDKSRQEAYKVFIDENSGLEMKEYEIGRAGYTSSSRLAVYVCLNVLHLVLWIVCLWMLLGFELTHAMGLGFVLWVVATVAVFPGLFEQAAAAVG